MYKEILNINLTSVVEYSDQVHKNVSSLFDVFTYPGGELQTRMKADFPHPTYKDNNLLVSITSYMRSTDDLMVLAQVCDIIRHQYPECVINVTLPYLPYGRADRRFTNGDTCGLVVFSHLISSIMYNYNVKKFTTLDPHPNMMKFFLEDFPEESINGFSYNFIIQTPDNFIIKSIKECIASYDMIPKGMDLVLPTHEINLVFPDNGAFNRYARLLPEVIGNNISQIKLNKLFCEKERDVETGKFKKFVIPSVENFIPDCPILIIDDICDGGGTFLGISDELEKAGIHERQYLYVTHGIFSKGLFELLKRFEKIYTTDSFYGKDTWFKNASKMKVFEYKG